MAERKTPYPVVPGLTDARRAELQNIIADHRQKYPVLVTFPSLTNILTCTCEATSLCEYISSV